MIQEIKAIQSVASIALTLLKESTLSKLAKGDLKIALETFKQIHTEANPEAGLNRALCQFELAYQHQVDSIDRWKFWQADKKHWPEYTTANKICVYIALINYILGKIGSMQSIGY